MALCRLGPPLAGHGAGHGSFLTPCWCVGRRLDRRLARRRGKALHLGLTVKTAARTSFQTDKP